MQQGDAAGTRGGGVLASRGATPAPGVKCRGQAHVGTHVLAGGVQHSYMHKGGGGGRNRYYSFFSLFWGDETDATQPNVARGRTRAQCLRPLLPHDARPPACSALLAVSEGQQSPCRAQLPLSIQTAAPDGEEESWAGQPLAKRESRWQAAAASLPRSRCRRRGAGRLGARGAGTAAFTILRPFQGR